MDGQPGCGSRDGTMNRPVYGVSDAIGLPGPVPRIRSEALAIFRGARYLRRRYLGLVRTRDATRSRFKNQTRQAIDGRRSGRKRSAQTGRPRYRASSIDVLLPRGRRAYS
jgi:hypothetical protein